MDFDMDEFFIEPILVEEIDIDYEFDAAKYYDFTRQETNFEAEEAQRWFETAGYNPPSPIIIKLNWKPSIPVKSGNSSFICRAAESRNSNSEATSEDNNNTRLESHHQAKSSTKSPLSKHSNFMNPTASQLAKQNCPPHIHCHRLLRRSQKFVRDEEKSSRTSSMNGTQQATKKQKLEAGYLWKAARLQHQALFSHKPPKTVGLIDVRAALAKPKVTIPREPNLETANRAERHRTKINSEFIETTKSDTSTFRARPLNRKILEAPSVPLPKKSTPQLPEFQVFHLRTSERAMQHASVNAVNAPDSSHTQLNETISSRRVTTVAALKEKLEAIDSFKARCLNKKECNFPTDKRFSNEAPIESLFSKLSLASELHTNAKYRPKMPLHPKGSKENAPGSLHLEHEMKNFVKSQRPGGSHFQCGSDRTVPSILPQINRSLDIR